MDWWRWIAAAVEALLLIVLVLLYFDTLRDRTGWTTARAAKRAGISSVSIPIGFTIVLFVPIWVGLILIAIPAIAVGAMALAS